MDHDTAVALLASIRTSQLVLKHGLIQSAVRYARLRTDWRLAAINERRGMDAGRTAAHNTLIDAANILSRAMVKAGEDVSWRRKLGDDRQQLGDWACHVHAHLGIEAR